jgi:hypothetical protein
VCILLINGIVAVEHLPCRMTGNGHDNRLDYTSFFRVGVERVS